MKFIQSQVVVRITQSKKLISHNEQNSTANMKFTILIEIAPVCKDDLVLLPEKLSRKLGGIGPLVLCYKISKSINIVDVKTMETFEIDNATYWKYQFGSLMTRSDLVPFVVVNIDKVDFEVNESKAAKRNKFKLVEAEVQRDSDIGVTDKTYFTFTHLGDTLEFNNTVLAYDLEAAHLEGFNRDDFPDVVLVRKSYPKSRDKRKEKKRNWKLKHINIEADKGANTGEFFN